MQRFEEPHAAREPQFGHPWVKVCSYVKINRVLSAQPQQVSWIGVETNHDIVPKFEL